MPNEKSPTSSTKKKTADVNNSGTQTTSSVAGDDVRSKFGRAGFHQTIVDQIFVLQFAIRRFQEQAPEDFSRLISFRQDLQGLLDIIPSNSSDGLQPPSEARLLESIMDIWDRSEEFFTVATVERRETFKQKLRRELDVVDRAVFRPQRYLSDQHLDQLICIFYQHMPIRELLARYNYFEYFSPFAMSCFISGKNLYTHYLYTQLKEYTLLPNFDPSDFFQESLWLLTREAEEDPELSAMMDTSCYEPGTSRSNVEFFSSSKNKIEIDGKQLANKLILSVPYDLPPQNIDLMLLRFRTRLIQEARRENDGYHAILSPNFNQSLFMNRFSKEPCLITRWDQVQRHMLGLWIWDEVTKNGKRPELASGEVANELESWKKQFQSKIEQLNLEMHFPEDRTILSYFRKTAAEISPSNSKEHPKIDTYLFSNTFDILGNPPLLTEEEDIAEWIEMDDYLSNPSTAHLFDEINMEEYKNPSPAFSKILNFVGVVNFFHDEELDTLLRSVKKQETKENHETLRLIGHELAKQIGSIYAIPYEFFRDYLSTRLDRLT